MARWCFSNRGIQDDDTSMCVLRRYVPPKNMEAGELSTDDDATMLRAGEIFWVELLAYGNVGRGQY